MWGSHVKTEKSKGKGRVFGSGQNMFRGYPTKQNERDCSKQCRGHYLRLPLHPDNG